MKLIAIETATEACSVALYLDGEVRARQAQTPRAQTELLLPMLDELLAEAGLLLRDCDGIAYSRGPGAFTGVRIGASIAQGLALGADLPVMPVSSLQTAAQGACRVHGWDRVLVVFDARMDEVYAGAFVMVDGVATLVGEEHLAAPATLELTLPEGEWFGAGNGWRYHEILSARFGIAHWDAAWFPQAEDVARLAAPRLLAGEGVAPELALPVYLRDDVWKKLPGR